VKEDLTLRSLEVFRKLCETLSFSESAQQLGLAQSNVSRQLKILEESLGVTLVQRSRHSVQLTSEGERLRDEVFPVTFELEQRLLHFKGSLHDEEGTVRLGCFSEFGQSEILPMLLSFQKDFPRIILNLSYQKESEILERLSGAKLDFGILSRPPILERLRSFPLVKQKIALALPKNASPRSWTEADILATPFVAYEQGDALLSDGLNHFFPLTTPQKKPRVKLIVNSHRSILDAVAFGGYAGVLPLKSIEVYPDRERIEVSENFTFEVPLYLVHAATQWLPRKDELLKKFLFKTFRSPTA
jgi:DNA-binding transcriptional LysR family regulator